jgi:RNA polymerase sigma-70 factor (ECF subfamily)
VATSTWRDFDRRAEPCRRELVTHCYQMLGSAELANEVAGRALARARLGYGQFDDRVVSLRAWLFGIVTAACVAAGDERRWLPSGLGSPADDPDVPLVRGHDVAWLQPFPEPVASVVDLGFVAALQSLPVRQRAVLLLRDVSGFGAADTAAAAGMTLGAVRVALGRARSAIVSTVDDPVAPDRYVAAFEHQDAVALARLLADDVVVELPPYRNWFAGSADAGRVLAQFFADQATEWRLLPTLANGRPAFAAYARGRDRAYHAHSIHVPDRRRVVLFGFPELFPLFGLSPTLVSVTPAAR